MSDRHAGLPLLIRARGPGVGATLMMPKQTRLGSTTPMFPNLPTATRSSMPSPMTRARTIAVPRTSTGRPTPRVTPTEKATRRWTSATPKPMTRTPTRRRTPSRPTHSSIRRSATSASTRTPTVTAPGTRTPTSGPTLPMPTTPRSGQTQTWTHQTQATPRSGQTQTWTQQTQATRIRTQQTQATRIRTPVHRRGFSGFRWARWPSCRRICAPSAGPRSTTSTAEPWSASPTPQTWARGWAQALRSACPSTRTTTGRPSTSTALASPGRRLAATGPRVSPALATSTGPR